MKNLGKHKLAAMKYAGAIVLFTLVLLPCTLALAEVDLSTHTMLTNQTLLGPVQQTEYANWKLYQPKSDETPDIDMTQDAHFQDRPFFPVVAVQDDQAVLILLQKIDENWVVFGTNETALNRPGLMLFRFSMSSGYYEDFSECPIYFGFSDDEQAYFELGLMTDPLVRFHYINIGGIFSPAPKVAKRFFVEYSGMRFDGELIYSYMSENLESQSVYATGVFTDECKDDNFSTFDLSRVPLSMHDLMTECGVRSDAEVNGGKVLLKQSDADDSATLCEIPAGASLYYVGSDLDKRDWVLVAYEQTLGYLSKSNIAD